MIIRVWRGSRARTQTRAARLELSRSVSCSRVHPSQSNASYEEAALMRSFLRWE